jgi:hypothetical protein
MATTVILGGRDSDREGNGEGVGGLESTAEATGDATASVGIGEVLYAFQDVCVQMPYAKTEARAKKNMR